MSSVVFCRVVFVAREAALLLLLVVEFERDQRHRSRSRRNRRATRSGCKRRGAGGCDCGAGIPVRIEPNRAECASNYYSLALCTGRGRGLGSECQRFIFINQRDTRRLEARGGSRSRSRFSTSTQWRAVMRARRDVTRGGIAQRSAQRVDHAVNRAPLHNGGEIKGPASEFTCP